MKTKVFSLFPGRLITIGTIIFFVALNTNLFSQSAGSNIFNDDFNRRTLGPLWQASPFWSIVNESAYNFQDGLGGYLTTTNSYKDSSYVLETQASGFTTNYKRRFHITFGATGANSDSMYILTYDSNFGGRLTLSVSYNNIFEAELLDEAAVYPILNSKDQYKFKIAKYKSGLIHVYIDNGKGYGTTPLLETINTSYKSLGHFGWREDTEGYPESFYVNWIKATKPSIEKSTREKPTEDGLITQVSAESGKSYKVKKLTSGVKLYSDRDYYIKSLPSYLEGASFIQTANDDKSKVSNTFLTSFYKKSAVLYVGYDPRAKSIPTWLSTWNKTTDRITTTDPGTSYLELYSKIVDSWELYPYPNIIGANLASPASGANANYMVAAVVRPVNKNLEAEDALISGAVKANNHTGYQGFGFVDFLNTSKDFIEWTVQIGVPGTYNLGFTYSNGSNSNRSLLLSRDNNKVGMLEFISTRSWDSWAFLSGAQVYLSAGAHKIRTTVAANGGPNIDQISLYYSSDAPPSSMQTSKMTALERSSKFSLEKNTFKVYPNPIIESSTLEYSVEKQSHVNLSIQSAFGQQLEVLVNSVQQPGFYKSKIRAEKYSNGVYYLKLQIGNNVQVRKLIKVQ